MGVEEAEAGAAGGGEGVVERVEEEIFFNGFFLNC